MANLAPLCLIWPVSKELLRWICWSGMAGKLVCFFFALSMAVASVMKQEDAVTSIVQGAITIIQRMPEEEEGFSLPRRLGLEQSYKKKSDSVQIKATIVKAMRLAGGVLSLSVLLLPFIGFWSSGNVENTLKLYSELELGCAALSSYGWLLYSVLQVSFKDREEIIGIDAIVIYGFSWGFIGFMLVVVMLSKWEAKGRVCLIGLVLHIILTAALLQFPIFKWLRKDSQEKLVFGVISAIFQNAAELIPLIALVRRWSSNVPVGEYPQIPNYKKFIIISRAFDSLAAIYWMLYCVLIYEFDEYGISSIICGGLSVISLCAHSAWAIKPN